MLIGIPSILSPDLLKILMEMGHGDEIVFADGNFPAAGMAKRITRLDGHGIPAILSAVIPLFPLDSFVESPVAFMAVSAGVDYDPVIQAEYREIICTHAGETGIEMMERFAFYERAKQAYAIVATGEGARYANIILKKGVVV